MAVFRNLGVEILILVIGTPRGTPLAGTTYFDVF